jgi:NAD(P)-dependent dehydrogenase (short-subunit alcohol dehydrogenase family)
MSQVFFITGSSRGLGRAIAVAALDAGHRVVATARDPETLRELVATAPDRVLAVPLDVTSPSAADAAVAATVERFGRLDVLVNNAGYANVAAIEDVDPDDFRAQLETNLFGVVTVTRAALPVMRGQGSGHVIQVSSVGGRLATPGLAAYQSAKWAVGGFSGVLAAEVAPLGIRVTVLEPGGMQTDWAGSSMQIAPVSEPYRATVGVMAALHESDRIVLGDPARVAAAVVRVAAMDDPPLRLLLGSDAFAYATAAGRVQLDSDERWRELSASTDRVDATDADRDPLGTAAGAAAARSTPPRPRAAAASAAGTRTQTRP